MKELAESVFACSHPSGTVANKLEDNISSSSSSVKLNNISKDDDLVL